MISPAFVARHAATSYPNIAFPRHAWLALGVLILAALTNAPWAVIHELLEVLKA